MGYGDTGFAIGTGFYPAHLFSTGVCWMTASAGPVYRDQMDYPRREVMLKCEYCGRPHAYGKETCSWCGAPLKYG
jgi:hypothetical protein